MLFRSTTCALLWLDELFELFGELQEVQPVFEDNPALTLDGYETWFSVAGAPAYNSGSAYSIPANPWLDLDSQAAPGALPGAAAIDGFIGYAQSYNLDCETRSAVDLASYFNVRIDYMSFLTGLPKSDDPNEGFVGNYWDARGGLPPNGYGVYERPVAELLTSFGLPSFGVSNFNWEGIKEQVARGESGYGVGRRQYDDGNAAFVYARERYPDDRRPVSAYGRRPRLRRSGGNGHASGWRDALHAQYSDVPCVLGRFREPCGFPDRLSRCDRDGRVGRWSFPERREIGRASCRERV